VNTTLISLARKEVKIVATNNTFYIDKGTNAHDILLCVREGEKQTTPIGRGQAITVLPNQEYYFKTGEEMKSSLLTCLKRFGIYRKSWIKLKYTIWRGGFMTI
jgi:DNA polymerase III alpha subunit